MILDTAFLIELLREERAAFDKGAELSERGVPQRIPSPVLYELQYGVEMFGDDDERRVIGNLNRLYPVVRVNEQVARRAAELVATADRTAGGPGETGIDDVDPLVAAVADTVDEPVLTTNVDDFETLGVPVETW
ncbi:MAG: PIN domain-containing protein [Haloarculaceae archaeon]